MDLAKSAMAQISEALRSPMWSYEKTIRSKNGLKVDVRKGNVPAWFLLGAAIGVPIGLWILGLGLSPQKADNGKKGLALIERPRLILPFTSGTATTAGASQGLVPDWIPFFGFL